MNQKHQRRIAMASCGVVVGLIASGSLILLGGRVAGIGLVAVGVFLVLASSEVGKALTGFSWPHTPGLTARLASATTLVGGFFLIGMGTLRLLTGH